MKSSINNSHAQFSIEEKAPQKLQGLIFNFQFSIFNFSQLHRDLPETILKHRSKRI